MSSARKAEKAEISKRHHARPNQDLDRQGGVMSMLQSIAWGIFPNIPRYELWANDCILNPLYIYHI